MLKNVFTKVLVSGESSVMSQCVTIMQHRIVCCLFQTSDNIIRIVYSLLDVCIR